MAQPVVIVTRPGAAGQVLTHELQHAGVLAEHWPAFEFGPAPDADAVYRVFLNLEARYDCVVFVSPQAVRAVRDAAVLNHNAWPRRVMLAATGAATEAAARDAFKLPADAMVVAPGSGTAEDSGAQALWPTLRAMAPHRVLIVRAQHGREWLQERLVEVGAQVETVAAYSRWARPLSDVQKQQVLRWQSAGQSLTTVFSSSEAVEVVLMPHDEATDVLRKNLTVATHPRIAERLSSLGAMVVTTMRVGELVAQLRRTCLDAQ